VVATQHPRNSRNYRQPIATALTKGMEPELRLVIAPPERLSLDLPLSGRRATPGELVVTSPCLSGNDDVMAHQMAGHATRMEHPEYGRAARGSRLRIAPHLREPNPAGLGGIEPRHALEQKLVVLR